MFFCCTSRLEERLQLQTSEIQLLQARVAALAEQANGDDQGRPRRIPSAPSAFMRKCAESDSSCRQSSKRIEEPDAQDERYTFRRRFGVLIGLIGILLGAAIGVYATDAPLPNLPPEMVSDAMHQIQRLLNTSKESLGLTGSEERDQKLPALKLVDKLSAKHPVVLVPGLVSTGLEVWEAGECLGGRNAFFRKRLWGTTSMMEVVLKSVPCWLEHMSLHPETGLDPPGVRLRAAQGFEAADYLIFGYWVWAKLIENLGVIGYDSNRMAMLSYDWRLKFANLEKRDHFMSYAQLAIEHLVANTGEKAVIIAHSMGANVWFYFMQWVTRVGRSGKGDTSWIDKHIHSVVNLGGPLLGAFGPLTALLSGEMHMGNMGGVLESIAPEMVGRLSRRKAFRTWGSMYELLPIGGRAVWGTKNNATDFDNDVISRRDGTSLDIDEVLDLLRNSTGDRDISSSTCKESEMESCNIGNPLEEPLPLAPNLRMFCMYGVNLRTERGYIYSNGDENDTIGSIDYAGNVVKPGYVYGTYGDPNFAYGLGKVDGDGTVPLLSLGYMCQAGWRSLKALNPGSLKTYIREYVDQTGGLFDGVRGGPKTAKHVEILGNSQVIEDLLHIAAGKDKYMLKDRVSSLIAEISQRVTAQMLNERPELRNPKTKPWNLMRFWPH